MTTNNSEKTLYLIEDGKVTQKLVWDEQVSMWVKVIASEMDDMANSILSRFEIWVNSVGLIMNISEAADGWCTPFTAEVTRVLEIGDEVWYATNKDCFNKLWKKN